MALDSTRSLEEILAARIRRFGPVPFDELMALALYDPVHGFYASGGSAGRRGDFITSPEVGPLFGILVARALDQWWDEMGRPDPFVVVEAGAGRATLARSVGAAGPRCGPVLTYVLVEQSAALRDRHRDDLSLTTPHPALPPTAFGLGSRSDRTLPGPRFVSLAEMPALPGSGVVLANELLDNLPFHLLERRERRWAEVRTGIEGDADRPVLREVVVPVGDALDRQLEHLAPGAPEGARVPWQADAVDWLRRALRVVDTGRVVVLDYVSTTDEIARRPMADWLRTYHGHQRGGSPLELLGAQDITGDVCVDQLARVRPADSDRTQAEFLRSLGLDELVAEGRRTWHERAHVGDLEALRGRSRVREAEALSDPAGLGGFRVLEWVVS